MQRLVRFATGHGARWGVESGGRVLAVEGTPFTEGWRCGGPVGVLDELSLLPPVQPSKIVCVGRNYRAHAAEHGAEVPQEPLLFLKPPSSVIGHGQPVVLPRQSSQVEHEAELAVVVGRSGRHIPEAEAWHHVLGLCCANDVTARDLQRRDSQWTRGKGFDSFCPLGPCLVTGLAEEEAAKLAVRCRVNGELRQDGRTSQMVFSPAYLIAYVSAVMTLEVGDLILTGTPAGVGPLAAGDVVEVEVERLGTLRNPVIAG